ncbi:MAG TPA: long-chain-fatty-acid--CoA ligase [Elusimicrobiota bacterium]|nr:long-chain-fatty-acid--CoA ligase [Elusimicrobiota bacterium]
MKTLSDMLDAAAQTAASKTALTWQDGRLSFGEFRDQVLGVARGLRAAGIGRGDCVAIIHRNAPEFVVSYFALARLGAVAVPINYMIHKADELVYMLKDCGAKGCVTQKEFIRGVRGAAKQCPALKRIWMSDASSGECQEGERVFASLLQAGGEAAFETVAESDAAAILYTSGTTGNPKGVVLTHRNLTTNCMNSAKRLEIRGNDAVLCILPMFHTFAWTGNVLISVHKALKLVVVPNIVPPTPWLKLMAKEGVSLFSAVPQIYGVLAKQACGYKKIVLRWWFFRRVRIAISGAAPLGLAVQDSFESVFGIPILEGYGLTETSPVVSLNTPDEHRRGSVGRPIDGVSLKVIDEDGRALESGQEGEICVKGDCVMKSYYKLPEATAEAFTQDGWFKTGDIGIVDADGYLFIRDRKKDMIIIKGLKVFSAQVETTLLEHPDIMEAAVIGIPDEHGDEIIKAFVTLRPDAKADKTAILKYCREKFDPYKRPRDVEIVESLPKNALQKVLKRELRQREIEKRAAAAGS